ncbi:MAG TPA: xanthine dehydrogenase family protein molybdopterin-binding subunit [Gemmatimonadaceae bacterium]|jgi:xanthine dehydrogenase YagR molybdenum-binding subunit
MSREPVVGAPIDRVDGRLKVTGGAKYAAEYPVDRLVHAVMITSTIAKGNVKSINADALMQMPGVLAVLTPQNAPKLPGGKPNQPPTAAPADGGSGSSAGAAGGGGGGGGGGGAAKPSGGGQSAPAAGAGAGTSPMRVPTLLQDDAVHYNGQPIGVVVADTFEHATAAAMAAKVSYAEQRPALDISKEPKIPPEQVKPLGGARSYKRGDVDGGLASAAAHVEHTYTTPIENHNPMEVHNTIAWWEGDKLSVYDSTQGIFSVRNTLAQTFGIPKENVRVVAYFTGGGFGSKGGAWSHEMLCAMASKHVGRPVKLVLTRRQMFGPVGGRPMTIQRVILGAAKDGLLTAVRHTSTSNTSTLENWVEPALSQTRFLYGCENLETTYDLIKLNVGSPTFQRAPGESTGTFALESAMDELSYALDMDPVELRIRNYPDRDLEANRPFSSNAMRDAYRLGAEKFGWSKRHPKPRSMMDGGKLVGYGCASATYPARRQQAGTTAKLLPDGRVFVRAGSQEIGCGTYTIMSQIAADALGLPVDRIRFELGATDMPENPASTGSVTAASTGSAVNEAALTLKSKLDALLPGGLASNSASDLIAKNGGQAPEVTITAKPGAEQQQYSMHSFGAVFTEVHIDPDLGLIRIPRIVTAHGVGKVLNEKTARSQIQGGVTWGIGMALLEETEIDPRTGRYVNADLAEYKVPVNADVGMIDVHFVEEHDEHVNPIGVKGAGEIGITGVAASIANAVYHATGTRVRDLPIRLDKLL